MVKRKKVTKKNVSSDFVPDRDWPPIVKPHKKTSKAKTKIAFVLDETASMMSCKDKAISGFNEYITTLQQKDKGFTLTLTRFNTLYIKKDFVDKPIKDIPLLDKDTYRPDACTPLYDAIGKTINELQGETKILFIVLTDGEENSSKEFNKDSISKLIKEKETIGWEFVFLGADYKSYDDAWKVAYMAGFSGSGSVCAFSTSDFVLTMSNLANQTVSYSVGDTQKGKFFKTNQDEKDMS